MRRLLRNIIRRQQRMAYFVICFMLFLLATALAKRYGLLVVCVLWAGLVVLLEIGYRRLLLFEARNRRRWWAKQYTRRAERGIRLYIYLGLLLLYLLIHSSFTRYVLAALLAAGLIFAGIIRLMHRSEEV